MGCDQSIEEQPEQSTKNVAGLRGCETSRCDDNFHLSEMTFICLNSYCNHGENNESMLICRECGYKAEGTRGKWLCKLCYLSHFNEIDDTNTAEIDTKLTNFERQGVRFFEKE